MRFPLDISDKVEESLLFWISRYLRHKINSLSHAKVKNQKVVAEVLQFLSSTPDGIEAVSEQVRRLRREGGMHGVGTFYAPVEKLYHYILPLKLSSLREINADLVADFLTSITAGLSDATKINYKNGIINFFRYLSKNNENAPGSGVGYTYDIDISGWQGLRGNSGKKLPDYLTHEEIAQILRLLDRQVAKSDSGGTKKQWLSSLFYALAVRVLIYTGMRVSELLSIRYRDFRVIPAGGEQYYSFRIKGKGNNNREVHVKSSLVEPVFSEYLAVFSSGNENDPLFFSPTMKRSQISPSGVSMHINRILKAAGIRKRKNGAHLFRHTFGTLVYSKTKDIVLVQDMLGHNDPKTTRIYTHLKEDSLMRASSAFLP